MPPSVTESVRRLIERVPDRQIIDFLVQFFVAEINWSVVTKIPFHNLTLHL